MTFAELQKNNKGNIFSPFTQDTDKYLDNSAIDTNIQSGFGSSYQKKKSENGNFVTRNQMNALGNIASTYLFNSKIGYMPTFDEEFCNKSGGYPKGAILWNFNDVKAYRLVSLIDNNMVDFRSTGADGVNWIKYNSVYSTLGNVITSMQLLYEKKNTLPMHGRMASGVTSKDGIIILQSYIKRINNLAKDSYYNNKMTDMYGAWLSLYVSDMDIRNESQSICCKNSRFIISPIGTQDDRSSDQLSTTSFQSQSIKARAGSYWALWANIPNFCLRFKDPKSGGDQCLPYANGVSDGDPYCPQFAGAPFDGYINLYMG